MGQMREIELLKRAQGGDREALAQLLGRYQDSAYAHALAIVRDFHSARDVVQEAFLRVHQKLHQLQEPTKFSQWLHSIVTNAARMLLRRKKRERKALQPAPPADIERQAVVESGLSDRPDDFACQISAIVGKLSETLSLPVMLCYVEEFSTREAARYLGIKEGTLRKRLHDAKKQLQRAIVEMAMETFQQHRLPRDFAHRCVCGCARARTSAKERG